MGLLYIYPLVESKPRIQLNYTTKKLFVNSFFEIFKIKGGFFMYDEKVETLKVFSCGVTAFVYKALGGSAKIFIILCILMLVDTIFGWIKGIHNKNWSSKTARWGFSGKIIELIFIGVLYALDWALEVDYLKYFGIYYFGICEFASVLENLAEINNNVPEGLVELIKKTQFSIGTAIVNKVKDIISKFIDIDRKD